MAKKGDLVLVTGKGSEQAMCVGDKLIPWDDRKIIRELL
jgi:UDP-N-acetylmuramyl tripeptide synthase